MNQKTISQRTLRQPQTGPAWPVNRQTGLFVLFFLLIAALSAVAAPGITRANLNFGTVPPPPEAPLTLLVGPVEEVASDGASITVAGVLVTIGPDVKVDERVGPLVVGAWARVYGYGETSDEGVNLLRAVRIKVLPRMPLVRLVGPLDELSDSELTVDGILVLRTATTLVVGDPVPGEDTVSVRAAIQSDGRLLALHVVKVNPVRDDDDNDDTDEDRPGHTHLTGIITSLPANGLRGTWEVSGIEVEVTDQTKVHARVGLLVEGGWVKIKGQAREGRIIATQIKTTRSKHFLKLSGNLTSLTETEVTVDGITVDLSPTASIRGNPQPGKRVKVKGVQSDADTFLAVLVQARGGGGGPPVSSPGLVVRFTGEVEQLPPSGFYGEWKIAGSKVTVPPGAFIDEHKGSVAVGAFVEVTALLGRNNSLTAVLIVVTRGGSNDDDDDDDRGEWVEFQGAIERLPDNDDDSLLGEWQIDGKQVHVDDKTEIKLNGQTVAVGKRAKVGGWRQVDGSVRAAHISLVEDRGRSTSFAGVIQALPENTLIGDWQIDNRVVTVSPTTELKNRHGDFVVGQRVKVSGRERDGVVHAEKIETLPAPEVQHSGRIVSFPPGLVGDWLVGDKKVVSTGQTEFNQRHGAFAEGVLVKVKGTLQGDGSILAKKIETLPMPKIEHRGEILELPATADLVGLWRIGRYLFDVTSATELKNDLDDYAVGVTVKAKGRQRADGVVMAEKIEIVPVRPHDDD
jgi:mRNA-degrading endonuclease toxin of MazEF toxin-antitoxin module